MYYTVYILNSLIYYWSEKEKTKKIQSTVIYYVWVSRVLSENTCTCFVQLREVIMNIYVYVYILTLIDENTFTMFIINVFYKSMCNS